MADRFRVLSVMGRQLEEMHALYNAIAEVSGDQAVGLRLGSEKRPENYSRSLSPHYSLALFAMPSTASPPGIKD
jgi:hypothetical protein